MICNNFSNSSSLSSTSSSNTSHMTVGHLLDKAVDKVMSDKARIVRSISNLDKLSYFRVKLKRIKFGP